MRSHWVQHKGVSIFYQDFSRIDMLHSERVAQELVEVQAVVLAQPLRSVRVLADFCDTTIGKDLIDLLTQSSSLTRPHVYKAAVLGVTGVKRFLANTLMRVTGQALALFDEEAEALEWLAQD